uniref:Calmodulin n=1 Tax=Steinernema glaseri TaxID=37863 RepID=A0A1I7Y6K9_9BILA
MSWSRSQSANTDMLFVKQWHTAGQSKNLSIKVASPTAGQVKHDVRNCIEEAFKRMDSDNDGLINVNDYFHRDPWYTEYTKKTFAEMDVNGDGMASITEFKSYHDMIEEALKKEAEKSAFNWANETISKFDKNEDDMIDLAEINAFMKDSLNQTADNLESLIAPFDKHNDKKLDLLELTNFLANLPYDKLKPCNAPAPQAQFL